MATVIIKQPSIGARETAGIDILIQQHTDRTSDTYAYETAAGVAIPNTGWTAALTIRTSNSASATSLLALAGGSGITLGGASGTFSYKITATQAASLPVGVYWYDLQLIDGSAVRHKLLEGLVTVEGTVS